jgi:hypothetical protein
MSAETRRTPFWRGVLTAALAATVAGPVASAGAAGTVTVTEVAAVSATEGKLANPAVNATFTDTNAIAPSGFTITINWGDGTPLDTTSAVVTEVGGAGGTTYILAGSHTFREEGHFTVSVTVQETANPANTDTTTTPEAVLDAPLAPAPTVFSGSGNTMTGSARAAFEAAIGGADNGTSPGPKTSGFRRASWDDVALDGSDPASTVITLGHTVVIAANRLQPRGLLLEAPLAVSDYGFSDVNPGAGALLTPFSPPNDAAPFNTNTVALDVVAPSDPATTPVPQGTLGLGLVFLNAHAPGAPSLQFLNGDQTLLTVSAPIAGPGHPSFVGALFTLPVVTRVVITFGTDGVFGFDGTTIASGPPDGSAHNLVALDDIVLAEPQSPSVHATAGVPFAGSVLTFPDADPNGGPRDFSAAIDWGDGSTSPGTISPSAEGGFVVSGTHTYATPGAFLIRVTVVDLGGARAVLYAAASVAPAGTPMPPTGCAGVATFTDIDCQLDALIATVRSASDTGRLAKRLVNLLVRTQHQKVRAEQLAGRGKPKPAKGTLKEAIHTLKAFIALLRSHDAKRIIPATTRNAFLTAAEPILTDMKSLLASS